MKFLRQPDQARPQRPVTFSLIDIGRDTVKAVVVLVAPGQPEVQVVGYGQADTGNHDITGGRIEANAVTATVNSALTQAEDSTVRFFGQKIVPDDVIFALAGRATLGKLFTVRQTRPRPAAPITARELNQLRTRAERLVRQGLANLPVEGGQWQPLAVTDAGIRLDGRLVRDGPGLMGQEITFSVFGVAGQAATLRALQVLADRLDLAIANIVAATQALAALTPCAEAILLDIGLSGTDICLIRDNALVGTAWVPFGGGFFTQALAQALDVKPEKAVELKHALAAGSLAAGEANWINGRLDSPRQRWYEAVLEALIGLADMPPGDEPDDSGGALLAANHLDRLLPRRIYLTGGGSLLPGLDKLLRAKPAPFQGAPEITRLGNRAWPGLKDKTDSLDYDLFPLTLSLTIGLPD